jgi:hypothetical protein
VSHAIATAAVPSKHFPPSADALASDALASAALVVRTLDDITITAEAIRLLG